MESFQRLSISLDIVEVLKSASLEAIGITFTVCKRKVNFFYDQLMYLFRSEKKLKSSSSNGKSQLSPWLRPHLRVRVIDPQYTKGKYFKVKVTVEDVISLDECICRTDEGKVLEGMFLICEKWK